MQQSFPEQVKHYIEFCVYKREGEKRGRVDLTKCRFIYPTTLLPLTTALSKYGWDLDVDPKTAAGGYLSYILGRGRKKPYGRSYVAPTMLPSNQEDCASVLEAIYTLQPRDSWFSQNTAAFKYVTAELVDNIYEHSKFDYAYVMAQRYASHRVVELCFYDDGIGIPGSFSVAGKEFTRRNHFRAIYEAMKGVSTKNESGRGYGLSSNVEMFTDVGGEVLVVSGFGAIFANKGGIKSYRLASASQMEGTLVSIRVRDRARIPNIYEYLERDSSLRGVGTPETEL